MAKYSGRRVKLEIGLEPTRGGGPAGTAVKFLLPKVTMSLKDRVEKFKLNASQGHIAENHDEITGEKWVEGEIEGDLRDRSFGVLFACLTGESSSSGSTIYTHVYTLENNNEGQTMYIKVIDPNKTVLHRNVRITSLQITARLGDKVMFRAGFIGKAGVSSSSSVNAIEENVFSKNDVRLFLADTTGNLDSATRLSFKEFTLDFAFNAERDSSLGTAEPEDILTRNLRITGNYLLNYENSTFEDYYLVNTARTMRFELLNQRVTIGVSNNPRFYIDFVNVKHDDWDPDRSNDEIVKQRLNFECHLDEVNQIVWDDCKLINTQSTYEA